MSDFSNKCREYLKDTGENVYQLSASSGLDRTSLQRMITGKRLPGIDFVRQFCDSLRINPSQRRELMELYKIEKIGKEIYYNLSANLAILFLAVLKTIPCSLMN